MPTDTTIIDRLRDMANGLINGAPECWNGDDARAQVGWAQDILAAADALTAAHAALANLPGHTCHVSGDTCGGCEYAWERDKRIAAAHAARDAAERTSEGRLRQLLLKAEEARQEWTRAENAVAVRDALMEKLTTAIRERDEARAATWDAAMEITRTLQVSRDGVLEYSLDRFRHGLCAVFSEARAALEGR